MLDCIQYSFCCPQEAKSNYFKFKVWSYSKYVHRYQGSRSKQCRLLLYMYLDKVLSKLYTEWSTEWHQPLSSDGGALDSSSALSSRMTSWTGMISGYLLISWIDVGGAFLTGLATTVDRAGFRGWTTSLTWGQDRQLSLRLETDKVSILFR